MSILCTVRNIAVALLIATANFAQDSRGTIAGRVSDPHSVAVAITRVVIRNVETGIDTQIQTNEQGAYATPLLIPGSYQISAEHAGFKKVPRRGITLSVNDNI